MTENSANTIFGRQVGRYVLLEKLGEGGMATVYNAYDSRLERNVALKMILPSRQSSKLFLERFVREAKSLAQLSHTNIVKVLDYGEESGVPYLVMEYIQGGMLKDVMNQPFPWAQAAAILAPVARALDYVHKQQIVHRDVKPSNILLDANDQPMLSDFGVVQLLTTNETIDMATGVGIGTPDYMSPEQGMGKDTDLRADVYALGVVFFELVTGQKPFTAESPMAVVIKHVTGTFPRPNSTGVKIPQIVEDVIMKAVARDPDRRFTDMGEFAQALEELSRGERARLGRIRRLLRKRNPGKQAEGQKPRSRQALLPALVILLALLVLAGTAWVFRVPLLNTLPGQAVARYLPAAILPPTPAGIASVETPTSSPTPRLALTATPLAPVETPTLAAIETPTIEPTANAEPTAEESPTATNEPFAGIAKIDPNLPLTGISVPSTSSSLSNGTIQKIALWGIGGVNVAAWSPDGGQIALGTSDGIFIYDAISFEQLQFINTQAWVENLTFTSNGQVILAALRSGQVTGWNTATQSQVIDFAYTKPKSERLAGENNSPATVMAFSSNERYLAIGYKNGAISIWDIKNKRTAPDHTWDQYPTVTGLAFSADSRYLYGASAQNKITIWDIATDKTLKELAQSSPIASLLISADGSLLIGGGVAGNVYLIDTNNEKVLHSFSFLGAPVTSLALSPDKNLIAAGLDNGRIKVFRTPSSTEISSVQKELYQIEGHPDAVTSLAFTADGQTLASISWHEGLRTWQADSGTEKKSLGLSRPAVDRMLFSPDSQWLLVSSMDTATRAWRVHDGEIRFQFKGMLPKGQPFSKDGKYVVIFREAANTWEDGWLDIYSLPDGNPVTTLKGFRRGWQVSFSTNGKILVAGNPSSGYIWDTSTWEKIKMHGGPNDSCSQFYTPDSQRLAVIWEGAIIFNYDQRIETLCATRPSFAVPVYLLADQSLAIYRMDKGMLWAYGMDPDEVTAGGNKNRFAVSNRPPDELLAVSAKDTLMAFAQMSQKLLLVSPNWSFIRFNGRYLSDATSVPGTELLELGDQQTFQYKAAISPDDQILAVGSQFGTITLWAVP